MRRMNKLPLSKRVQILSMLCEGSSMRSVSRVAGVSINTVTKLLIDAGNACAAFHDDRMRNVKSKRIQCDEIWAFCYAKERNVPAAKSPTENAGNVWTWTAIDADTKLMVSWFVGTRETDAAVQFFLDLKGRLAGKVQLTSDGHVSYPPAVFETGLDVDYAQLVKLFGEAPDAERRYSPPECIGTRKRIVQGSPDPAHISTSFAERQNLQMRMSMKRYTRLTNAHSKKFENHCHALALYFFFYNWVRRHQTLKASPAMAAGLAERLYSWEELVSLIDAQNSYSIGRISNRVAD